MKKKFVEHGVAVLMLLDGWEIYTDRGFGNAPYNPLFYKICKGEIEHFLHHMTVKKMIKEKLINSRDNESGTGKYKLRITLNPNQNEETTI